MNLQEALECGNDEVVEALNKERFNAMLPTLAAGAFCLQEKGLTFPKVNGSFSTYICSGNECAWCDFYTMLSPMPASSAVSGDWEHFNAEDGTYIEVLTGASVEDMLAHRASWIPLPIVAEMLNVQYEGMTADVVAAITAAAQKMIEGSTYLLLGTEIESDLMGW